jgi:hypothetical protein
VETVGESKAWIASRHSALLSTACQSLALLKRTPGQLGQGLLLELILMWVLTPMVLLIPSPTALCVEMYRISHEFGERRCYRQSAFKHSCLSSSSVPSYIVVPISEPV